MSTSMVLHNKDYFEMLIELTFLKLALISVFHQGSFMHIFVNFKDKELFTKFCDILVRFHSKMEGAPSKCLFWKNNDDSIVKLMISITLYRIWKFFVKDFFSKCDQIRRKLRIRSHLLKKSIMENFIFCAILPAMFLCDIVIQTLLLNYDSDNKSWKLTAIQK